MLKSNTKNLSAVALALAWLITMAPVGAEDDADEALILQFIGIKRACTKAYPDLKDKIEASFFAANSGFDRKMREKMTALENSQDPKVQGRIEGAVAVFTQAKQVMELGCPGLTE